MYFNSIKLPRVTFPTGERYYICPETNRPLPSVTTILGYSSDKKQSLLEWEQSVGSKRANKEREHACNLGIIVHQNVENYLNNISCKEGGHILRKQAKKMSDIIINEGIIPNVTAVHGMEMSLYYPGLYAGTTDLLVTYQGLLSICDHKTCKNMRSEDMIDDYYNQLAAYIIAFEEMYKINIDMAVIFMVSRNLKFNEFKLNKSDIEKYKVSWLNKVELFYENFKVPDLSSYEIKYLG